MSNLYEEKLSIKTWEAILEIGGFALIIAVFILTDARIGIGYRIMLVFLLFVFFTWWILRAGSAIISIQSSGIHLISRGKEKVINANQIQSTQMTHLTTSRAARAWAELVDSQKTQKKVPVNMGIPTSVTTWGNKGVVIFLRSREIPLCIPTKDPEALKQAIDRILSK